MNPAVLGGSEDFVHVLQIAQGENACIVNSWQGRAQRRCARRQHQLVVGQPFTLSARKIAHFHALSGAIDTDRFTPRTHLEIEQVLKRCRSLHGKDVASRDFSADVVRQATVGKRNVRAALDDRNDCRFIQASCAGGKR